MFSRALLLTAALGLAAPLPAQTQQAPASFRLVLPQGPGAILIDNSGGWQLERFTVYSDNDGTKRPVLQLQNKALGIVASYALDHAPGYYETSEACRNDVLGGVMQGALAKAAVKNKESSTRTTKSGLPLAIGSYLVAKEDGQTVNQQAVWGFFAKDHTCAYIHLSRTPFKAGEERLFDAALDSFTYDPAYLPTPEDYATLAKLLPPGMAALYQSPTSTPKTSSTPSTSLDLTPQFLTFALADHPGFLSMDAPNLKVTELSAKPNGREFGIRADAADIQFETLGFLFLTAPPQPNAGACRDWMLLSEKNDKRTGYRKFTSQSEMKSASGVPVALAEYDQSNKPGPFAHVLRAFVAEGDLCADTEFLGADSNITHLSKPMLQSIVFHPNQPPDYVAQLRYASVLYAHKQYAQAADLYDAALPRIPPGPENLKWRRVASDQAAIAYGISGELEHSRKVSEAAIASDPDYPLSYYNLACADAESGDVANARKHLQQAFDRRANVLPGETMPDPTQDDSIQKLKGNKEFWAFVQALPKS